MNTIAREVFFTVLLISRTLIKVSLTNNTYKVSMHTCAWLWCMYFSHVQRKINKGHCIINPARAHNYTISVLMRSWSSNVLFWKATKKYSSYITYNHVCIYYATYTQCCSDPQHSKMICMCKTNQYWFLCHQSRLSATFLF